MKRNVEIIADCFSRFHGLKHRRSEGLSYVQLEQLIDAIRRFQDDELEVAQAVGEAILMLTTENLKQTPYEFPY